MQVGTFAIGCSTGFLFLLKESAKMSTVYIYGLVDPRNNQLRYVGKAKNPKQRLIYHLSVVRNKIKNNKRMTYKDNWIKVLLRNNLIPTIRILDICQENEWEEKEIFWIEKELQAGSNLANTSMGGEGGPSGKRHPFYGGGDKFTDEHRRHMSISARNKPPITEETREKMRKVYFSHPPISKGKKRSVEFKRRVSETLKSKPKTETHNKKNSLAVAMMWAKRQNKFDKIKILQTEYFNLFGFYNQKYEEYI